jgi:DNA invertase Pin-like site-specific DNA recombinase
MKTAYSYLRWSTKGQGNDTRDSRRRQTESAEKWIAEHGKGYTLSKQVFVDDGKSASKGKNIEVDAYGKAKGDLMRFIQLVEKGQIKNDSILLIDEFSRFSRLPAQKALTLFLNVLDTGIGLVFTGSYEKRVINSDLLNAEGNVLYFIIGEMIRSYTETAERGRKIKSSRKGKLELMKQGIKVAHNNLPKYLEFNHKTQSYVENEHADTLRAICQALLNGKAMYSISKDLNKNGIKTFCRGLEWRASNISALLRSRGLIGEFLGIADYLPPIISPDEFASIQNILNANKFNKGKRGNIVNVFRGVAFCECGAPMSATAHYQENFSARYMRCSHAGANVKCKARGELNLAPIEFDFFRIFLKQAPNDLMPQKDNPELKELDREINKAQTKISQLNKEYEVGLESMGILSGDAFKKKMVGIETSLELEKTKLNDMQLKKSRYQSIPKNALAIVRKIGQIIDFDTNTATPVYDTNMHQRIEGALESNETREKVRVMLPNVIGRMVFNVKSRQYSILNPLGEKVYTSRQFNKNHNSPVWKEAVKKSWEAKRQAKRIKVKGA